METVCIHIFFETNKIKIKCLLYQSFNYFDDALTSNNILYEIRSEFIYIQPINQRPVTVLLQLLAWLGKLLFH
jgi:hypothetical protein